MLQLGDVLIHDEEVLSVAWRRNRLRLLLRWELEEVPVLLDLPREIRLSWHGADDAEAGIPLRLDSWRLEATKLRVILRRASRCRRC